MLWDEHIFPMPTIRRYSLLQYLKRIKPLLPPPLHSPKITPPVIRTYNITPKLPIELIIPLLCI